MGKILFLALALLNANFAFADAACEPLAVPGLSCRCTNIVEYKPSTRWSEMGDFVMGHLAYINEQLSLGRIVFAGPFTDEQAGGIGIYTETDAEKIKLLVANDPWIANDVATFSIRPWQMCEKALTE